MTVNSFAELLDWIREQFSKADLQKLPSFLAIQFDLTGDIGGTFYAEYKDGFLSVEPYEYYDRNVRIEIAAPDFIKMVNGQLDPVVAYTVGKIKLDGDVGAALELKKLIP